MEQVKEHLNWDTATKNLSVKNNIKKSQNYLTSIGDLRNVMLVQKLNLALWKNALLPEEKELVACVYTKIFP